MHYTVLSRPVVLSYFAQSGSEEKEYLKSLEGEYKSIAEAWEQHHIQNGSGRYFEVFFPPRGSADGNKMAEDIRNYRNRIILFHFSGHAESRYLLFQDGASNTRGIAGLLGEAPNLKLVVLNGCATYDQVKLLFDNGVKIVMATQGKVNDGIAKEFASTFYKALCTTDYTIKGAYQHALHELQRKHTNLESISTEPIIWRGLDTESDNDHNRWELYVREEWERLIDDPNWWRMGDLPSSYSKTATLLSPKGVDNPNVFIGRKDELEAIRERLVKGGKLMLINAEGGIGKTTLAARYWNESLYEYQHNAWLFCENGIVNALKELSPSLNVELTGMNEAQQLATLRHALKQVQGDFLLVLDNANDAEDIRLFQREFAGFHWHVLITSRCQGALDKEQELSIMHLRPEQAKELFKEYYSEGTPDFDALLDRLLKAIDYHTLLVEVFAKNLKEASELGTSLADFLQKLETGGLYLGEDSFEIQTHYTDYVQKAAANTDDILDILYDFSTLSEEQRYLLVNLALLPAESYEMPSLIDVMAPSDKKAFHKTLKGLSHKGWVGGAENTYRLSPVVQALVLEKNKETHWEDAENLLTRFAELLKLEKDKDNIFAKFRWIPLSLPLLNYLYEIKNPLFSNFLNNLATVIKELGGENNLLFAKKLYEKALANDIDNFGEHSHIVAERQSNLATCLQSLGDEKNLERARELLEQSLATGIELFGTQSNVVTLRQSKLATILLDLGGPDNLMLAKELSENALTIDLNNLGENHPTVARRRFNLAKVLFNLGGESNLNRAQDLLEKSVASNTANFGKRAPSVAAGQSTLALVLRDIGDIDGKTNLIYANRLLEKAIETTTINFGNLSPDLIIPTWNLIDIYIKLKLGDKVREKLLFIYPIAEEHLPETHPLKALIREYYCQIKEAGF